MKRSTPEQVRAWRERSKPLKRSGSKPKRRPISPASPEQRAKVREARSVVSGEEGCDPAHVWPRSKGGCDDPLCTVPLTRSEHRAYDDDKLDLLPALLAAGCIPELQHALGHARSPLSLLQELTGTRWQPKENG